MCWFRTTKLSLQVSPSRAPLRALLLSFPRHLGLAGSWTPIWGLALRPLIRSAHFFRLLWPWILARPAFLSSRSLLELLRYKARAIRMSVPLRTLVPAD